MVPAVLAVAAVGGVGLQRIHRGTTILADDRLRTVQDNADLVSAAYALHETALLQLAADSPETDACVSTELDQTLIPRFESAFTTLRRDYAQQPDALRPPPGRSDSRRASAVSRASPRPSTGEGRRELPRPI